jgi:uncharacterized protein
MAALPDTRMPGVKTLEIATLPPSVALVPTAVPVFIGYTQIHEKEGEQVDNRPVRIRSMRDYEDWFGLAAPQSFTATAEDRSAVGGGVDVTVTMVGEATYRMYYALQLYFTNGGGPTYIISVGKYKTVTPLVDKASFIGGIAMARKAKEITILVLPDAVALNAAEYGEVITSALQHCEKYINRVTIIDVKDTFIDTGDGNKVKSLDEDSEVTTHFRANMPSAIGQKKYGAAYYPFLKTTMSYATDDSALVVTLKTFSDKNNLGTFAETTPKLSDLEAGKPAVAAIPASGGNPAVAAEPATVGNNLAFSKIKEAIRQFPVVMPPSAAVAGVYVATDFAQGVWKAPANVSLAGVVGTTVEIDDDFHADLNVNAASGKSVNAIRPYTGRGILIFGARTLAGNDLEWRYISVRRTFCFIEDAVGQAMQDFVFEANTRDTWIKVKAMIGNFLIQIWKAGGLFGNTPDEAFQVLVGQPETMNDIDILEGRMIVDIKLRVSRPAEFIILRYEHKFQTNAN